ncbi:MAG: sulfite exporter TauE/SafE family protein, partial [Myxococcales bacterium]
MSLEPTAAEATLLAAVAFVAGTIDAIAGGGGLLTLPALLAAGLPPHLALGTNKGQSVFGSAAALTRFWRGGLVHKDRALPSFFAGLLGALGGTALVLAIRPEVLKPLVLALLVAVAVFLAFRHTPKLHTSPRLLAHARAVSLTIALCIGAYDGFFGPGTGT